VDTSNIEIRFQLGDYLRPGSHKLALSVPELKQQTNEFSIKNQGGCAPALTGSNPKDLFLHYNVKCKLKTSDPAGHDVRVHFDLSQVVDETTAKSLDVACSCTCPAFLYWGAQWNLHERDALEGTPRPRLTAPQERMDLRGHFVICKHCKVVFDRILPSVQHNIIKVLRSRDVAERSKTPQAPKPRLDREQNKMRQRQDKQQVMEPEKQKVKDELADAVERREPEPAVVKRDEPATPEEKQRVDTVTPVEETPAPEISLEAPAQESEEPEEPEVREPQTIPELDDDDRDYINKLMNSKEE
jgi:hypothetical protein